MRKRDPELDAIPLPGRISAEKARIALGLSMKRKDVYWLKTKWEGELRWAPFARIYARVYSPELIERLRLELQESRK